MSNNRRKQVRCTMCTKWRWMGNAKNKKRVRDQRNDEVTKEMLAMSKEELIAQFDESQSIHVKPKGGER